MNKDHLELLKYRYGSCPIKKGTNSVIQGSVVCSGDETKYRAAEDRST
jgi:hypothetical protein